MNNNKHVVTFEEEDLQSTKTEIEVEDYITNNVDIQGE